jgi:hypothetical protein
MTILHLMTTLAFILMAAVGLTVISVSLAGNAGRILSVLGWRRGYGRTAARPRLMRA